MAGNGWEWSGTDGPLEFSKGNSIILRRFFALLLILIFLSSSLSSCNKEQESDWFSFSKCETPCWFELIPGKTTLEELQGTLYQIEIIEKQSIWNKGIPWNNFSDVYGANLRDGIELVIYLINNRISDISFFSARTPNELGITMGELIDRFGEPESFFRVIAPGPGLLFSEAPHTYVYFLYSKEGIIAGYDEYYLPKSHHNNISPEIELNTLDYFFPDDITKLFAAGLYSQGKANGGEDLKNIEPWKGYGIITTDIP